MPCQRNMGIHKPSEYGSKSHNLHMWLLAATAYHGGSVFAIYLVTQVVFGLMLPLGLDYARICQYSLVFLVYWCTRQVKSLAELQS